MNTSLILRRRGYLAFEGWRFWFLQLIFLSALISIGVLFYLNKSNEMMSKPFIYFPVAWAVFFYFQSQFMRKSRLEIDEFGLLHKSGLPEILKRFHPDWRISWSEIQKVEQANSLVAKNTLLSPLNLELFDKTIKIIPLQWVNPKEEAEKPKFQLRRDFSLMFENSPLVKIFELRGLLKVNNASDRTYQSAWENKQLGTDINSSPVSISMAGFLMFAVFYFIIEVYFTLSEYYAGTPPYRIFVYGAVITVILSYLLLLKTKFKMWEKVTLAVLMGFSTAAIMYPLMLRVNNWTDTEGLHTYAYTKTSTVAWSPDNKELQLPNLIFDFKYSDYWMQFETEDTKKFELRKGGLNFYQLNMEPVYADQRLFYEKDR